MVNINSITKDSQWWVRDNNSKEQHLAQVLEVYIEQEKVKVKWCNQNTDIIPLTNFHEEIGHYSKRRTCTKPIRFGDCTTTNNNKKPNAKEAKKRQQQKITKQQSSPSSTKRKNYSSSSFCSNVVTPDSKKPIKKYKYNKHCSSDNNYIKNNSNSFNITDHHSIIMIGDNSNSSNNVINNNNDQQQTSNYINVDDASLSGKNDDNNNDAPVHNDKDDEDDDDELFAKDDTFDDDEAPVKTSININDKNNTNEETEYNEDELVDTDDEYPARNYKDDDCDNKKNDNDDNDDDDDDDLFGKVDTQNDDIAFKQNHKDDESMYINAKNNSNKNEDEDEDDLLFHKVANYDDDATDDIQNYRNHDDKHIDDDLSPAVDSTNRCNDTRNSKDDDDDDDELFGKVDENSDNEDHKNDHGENKNDDNDNNKVFKHNTDVADYVNNPSTNNNDNTNSSKILSDNYHRIKVGTKIKKYFPRSQNCQEPGWYFGTITHVFIDAQLCEISYPNDNDSERVPIDSLNDSEMVKIINDACDFETEQVMGFNRVKCTFQESVTKRHKRLPKPDNIMKTDHLIPVVQEENPDKVQYFLKRLFQYVYIKKILMNEKHKLEKIITYNGQTYELLVTKLHEKRGGRNSKSWFEEPKDVKAYYVSVGKDTTLRRELERLGNFAVEKPTKIASRLEMMVSPAAWDKYHIEPLQYRFNKSYFELIDEKNHVGCGFAPPSFFEKYVSFARPAVVEAVQVRIFAGSLGWFKGILMKKIGIDKIQLPQSMCKVEKSQRKDRHKSVFLVIKQMFPTKAGIMMGRYYNKNKKDPPEKWEASHLESIYNQKMYSKLLLISAVPDETLDEYDKRCRNWEGRKHFSLIGVADPTDELPKGMVFITGLGVTNPRKADTFSTLKILITRFPCTEKNDLVLVDCVRSKPPTMSDKSWEFLQSLSGGMLVFGPPKDGRDPIPQDISNGDLDGDHYQCLWDESIVACFDECKEIVGCAAASVNVAATDIDEETDPLLNAEFQHKIDDDTHTATVSEKLCEKYYEVTLDNGKTIKMSRDEILDGHDFILEILSHNDKGSPEVLVKWVNQKKPSWEPVKNLKETHKDILAEYAIEKGLLDRNGWKWAAKHISESEMIKILNHFGKGHNTKVVILYDDGSKDEKLLTEVKLYAEDLLAEYCKEKGLQNMKEWKWVPLYLKKTQNEWFENTQDLMCNTERLFDFSNLTTRLHTLYKQFRDKGKFDTMEVVGQAYKQSVDMRKHGGKVNLPNHLHKEIKPDRLQKFLTSC